MEQIQPLTGADRLTDRTDGRRIAEVPTGRRSRQQQVLFDERDEGLDIGRVESHPSADRPHEDDPDVGVVLLNADHRRCG